MATIPTLQTTGYTLSSVVSGVQSDGNVGELTPDVPWKITRSYDRKEIFATSILMSPFIWRLDLGTGKVLDKLLPPASPASFVWGKPVQDSAGHLYGIDGAQAKIYKWNNSTGTGVFWADVAGLQVGGGGNGRGGFELIINQSESKMYVVDSLDIGGIYEVDMTTQASATIIAGGGDYQDWYEAPDMADDTTLWCSNVGVGQLVKVDVVAKTATVVYQTDGLSVPQGVAIKPDDPTQIWFSLSIERFEVPSFGPLIFRLPIRSYSTTTNVVTTVLQGPERRGGLGIGGSDGGHFDNNNRYVMSSVTYGQIYRTVGKQNKRWQEIRFSELTAPGALAINVSPSGQKELFVADFGATKIYDAETGQNLSANGIRLGRSKKRLFIPYDTSTSLNVADGVLYMATYLFFPSVFVFDTKSFQFLGFHELGDGNVGVNALPTDSVGNVAFLWYDGGPAGTPKLSSVDLNTDIRTDLNTTDLVQPVGMVVQGTNLLITDRSAGKVVKIPIAGGAATDFITGLTNPEGIAIDNNGKILVVEVDHGAGGGNLKRFLANGTADVTILSGLNVGLGDNPASTLYVPPHFQISDVVVDPDGVIYVSQDARNEVLSVIPD